MGLVIESREIEPQKFVVAPRGEINTETHAELEKQVFEMIPKAMAINFDMSGVTYMSSMGLSAIFRVKLAMEGKGGVIVLTNLQPQVALVFDAMKVISPQMFASLEEADDFLDSFLDGIQKGRIKPRDSR
jgi:anti-anti-sigma factor